MNGKCTCGVELVEGARFCHKCGRPVDGFEPVVDESVEPAQEPTPVVVAAPVVPPPLPPRPVGFRNRDTLRAALFSAVITFLPSSAIAEIYGPLLFGGLLVNGLLSVLLYLRRTGRHMTTIEGARQGWVSGLMFFCITFLLSGVALLASGKGGFAEVMRQQAKAQGPLSPEMSQILDQPGFLAVVLVAAVVIGFILFTSLASLGGMLGARLFGNNSDNAHQETGS
ncbi:MAG TPA: zinc ribbon domain-containing protein [Bryobacteraceae bacterium]